MSDPHDRRRSDAITKEAIANACAEGLKQGLITALKDEAVVGAAIEAVIKALKQWIGGKILAAAVVALLGTALGYLLRTGAL